MGGRFSIACAVSGTRARADSRQRRAAARSPVRSGLPAMTPVHVPEGGPPPKLLDRVRAAVRVRHYSRRTEQAYVDWIRRYILFHQKKHPSTMGAAEIVAFLSWLAVDRQVSASTQNQALSAVLFLYKLRGAPRNRYYV